MTDKTKQKIMDVALKIFAKEGYKATTTRAIAYESGYTELTLFRKFKTKKNLYETVLNENLEKMMKDYVKSVLIDKEYENPREFLDTFVKNSLKTSMDNFEIFYLIINNENKMIESVMENTMKVIAEYIEKNIPNKDINYKIFGLSINSFVYMINLERYHGRSYSLGKSYEETVENVIDILSCMIDS